MGGKKKANKPQKQARPYFQWAVREHLVHQAQTKGILPSAWKAITNGEVEIIKDRKLDDKCEVCRHFKFDFYMKEAPKEGIDPRIIGCANCEVFITVYPHERTHGNTPIHAYQIAQGVTEYTVTCTLCGHRTKITTEHKTQAQVDEALKHDCRGRK